MERRNAKVGFPDGWAANWSTMGQQWLWRDESGETSRTEPSSAGARQSARALETCMDALPGVRHSHWLARPNIGAIAAEAGLTPPPPRTHTHHPHPLNNETSVQPRTCTFCYSSLPLPAMSRRFTLLVACIRPRVAAMLYVPYATTIFYIMSFLPRHHSSSLTFVHNARGFLAAELPNPNSVSNPDT